MEHTLITVEEMRRLLDKLDPTDQLSGRTCANTGNLVIIRDGRDIGWIDLWNKEICYYEM
jgi:hypothetical protein